MRTKLQHKADFESLCESHLGIDKKNLEFFRLVPLRENENFSNLDELQEFNEIGIRVKNTDLSLRNIEDLIKQRDNYKEQLQRTNEGLKTYLLELKKMRKFLVDDNDPEPKLSEEEKKKYKKLEEDNKRLRKLLKTQLENSENLRIETQHTVETLREEFDLLVKELINFKSKEAQGMLKDNVTKSTTSANPKKREPEEKSQKTTQVRGGSQKPASSGIASVPENKSREGGLKQADSKVPQLKL